MQIAIVGFGETGSCIASLIIHQFSNVKIHVLDPSDSISGRLLDMQHAAAFRNSSILHNQQTALSKADYIFYCAGIRNAKDGDRISVTHQNKELIAIIFGDSKLKSTAKIIVVTNPVELISTWISEYFEHKIVVIGTGTLLDTYRFKFLISNQLSVLSTQVKTLVLGEHGDGMTPILSQTKVSNESIQSLLSDEELTQLTQALKNSAKTIRLTEEATKYGVSECAMVLLNQFESKTPVRTIASVAVPTSLLELLQLKSPIFFSLECLVSKGGVEVIEVLDVSTNELDQLKIAASRLENVYMVK